VISAKTLLPIVLGAAGCAASPTARPAEVECAFDWLVGTWTTEDGSTTERWALTPSGTLEGESVTRKDGAVVFTETLAIRRGPAGLEYFASPSGQAPHAFALETCGDSSATFSDPGHDWPQSLSYRRSGDTLTATVEGVENGEPRTATWTWTAE
jgi:hypothetical protein